ncbi:MAG: hypothetical protein BGP16_11670 [Sphingobium sp. 66-54]|nr:MAG: hypothetical protein BGP16_11670 [Sphingobium sp. 66-54]
MDYESDRSSRRRGRGRLALFLALPPLVMTGAAPAQPGMSEPPDLSGWWVWVSPQNGEPPFPFLDAPYKGPAADVVAGVKEATRRAKLPDPADLGIDQRRELCKPPRFGGFNGRLENAVEFLFTPGRLTITDEGGLIRRISLDGSTLPKVVEESNMGTSVGHWEGQVLVIETVGTRRSAGDFLFGLFSRDAGFTERLTLRDPDTLEIALHAVAPDVLERPYDKILTYTRDRGHVFQEFTWCVDNDPSFNPRTGREELDLTPPADLPPPPAD